MSRNFQSKSGNIEYDGSMTIELSSGRMTNAAAAQFGQVIVAPCDLYVHSIHVYIDTGFTHASSKLNLGNLGDDDAYVDGIVLQNIATGYFEHPMLTLAGVSGRRIPKGTPVCFSLDAADTTGKVSATAVLIPYSPT